MRICLPQPSTMLWMKGTNTQRHFVNYSTYQGSENNSAGSPVWLHIQNNWIPGWWFGTFLLHFLFFHILGINIPTDFHSMIFQRGRYSTNQILIGILSPWVENHQPEYYVHRFSIKKAPGILTHTWFPGFPDPKWMVFWPTGTTILNHSRNMNPYFWVNSNDRTLFSRSLE